MKNMLIMRIFFMLNLGKCKNTTSRICLFFKLGVGVGWVYDAFASGKGSQQILKHRIKNLSLIIKQSFCTQISVTLAVLRLHWYFIKTFQSSLTSKDLINIAFKWMSVFSCQQLFDKRIIFGKMKPIFLSE